MTGLFAADPIPLDAQIAEIDRELMLRDRVYGHRINTGKMSRDRADIHTENLKAARETLLLVKKHDLLRHVPPGEKGGPQSNS